MASSILTTVKKTLGLDESYTVYDPDLILLINSVLANLNQIGVGEDVGFQIEDKNATWESFLGSDPRLNNVKAYTAIKVRLLFDAPATSFAIAALESQAKELEFRIYMTAEVATWQEEHPVETP